VKPSSDFRSLHAAGRLLILPNAWDAASARLVEAAGADAIATSSAAVSWSHGVADGEHLDRAQILATVGSIARAVRLPISVDLEAGYSDDPAAIDALVAEVLALGVAGINLEDGQLPPATLARRIAIVRAAADRLGADLFINARVDVYLKKLVPAEDALAETLRRLPVYRDAGCDGLFVPGVTDEPTIRTLVAATPLPLNLLALPQLAPAAELQRWGVRRLSVGSALASAAYAVVRNATRELLATGSYDRLFAERITGVEMNALWTRDPR
jgi:2-methylisocitrate lyase-like PEP mutase family enzyme